MKKLLKVLMISMLALTLVACGGTDDKDKDGDEGKTFEVAETEQDLINMI